MRARIFAVLLAAGALAGCAGPQPMYAWGRYDEALYAHYRAPQDRETWVANLKTVILEAEQEDRKVPPGIYAEYGYALLEEGQYDAAKEYFAKEREKWPESQVLMEKMSRNADRLAGRAPPTKAVGPAGAVEKASTDAEKKAPAATGKKAAVTAKKAPAAREKTP